MSGDEEELWQPDQPQDAGANILVRMCARCGKPSGGGDLCPPCKRHLETHTQCLECHQLADPPAGPSAVPCEAKLTVDKRLSIIRSVTIKFQVGTREYTKELCRLFEAAATEKATAYIRQAEVAPKVEQIRTLWQEDTRLRGEVAELGNALLDKSVEEQMAMVAWRDACQERDTAREQLRALVEAADRYVARTWTSCPDPELLAAIAAAKEAQDA